MLHNIWITCIYKDIALVAHELPWITQQSTTVSILSGSKDHCVSALLIQIYLRIHLSRAFRKQWCNFAVHALASSSYGCFINWSVKISTLLVYVQFIVLFCKQTNCITVMSLWQYCNIIHFIWLVNIQCVVPLHFRHPEFESRGQRSVVREVRAGQRPTNPM